MMNNPMNLARMQSEGTFEDILQRARSNPQGFEDYMKRTNPQAYQMALEIRNTQNPKSIIRQMIQSKGINPGVLNMLGLL